MSPFALFLAYTDINLSFTKFHHPRGFELGDSHWMFLLMVSYCEGNC